MSCFNRRIRPQAFHLFVLVCALWCTVSPLRAHVHVQATFTTNEWRLLLYDFDSGEFDPDTTPLFVAHTAFGLVPAGAFTNFLGRAGGEVWTLPETENASLLFLGFGTMGIPPGLFSNNEIQFQLRSVDGPGHFAVYTMDPFGSPVIHMNSRDGVLPSLDRITIPAINGHAHVNWAFSAPGTYQIGFAVSGRVASSGQINTSPPAEFTFNVQDVPWRPRLTTATAPDGTRLLTVSASITGRLCSVWASSDLQNWQATTNFVLATNTVSFPMQLNATNRFFRVSCQ